MARELRKLHIDGSPSSAGHRKLMHYRGNSWTRVVFYCAIFLPLVAIFPYIKRWREWDYRVWNWLAFFLIMFIVLRKVLVKLSRQEDKEYDWHYEKAGHSTTAAIKTFFTVDIPCDLHYVGLFLKSIGRNLWANIKLAYHRHKARRYR